MYYRPLLPNGKEVTLSWQILFFFLNITWPLADTATAWQRHIDRIRVASGIFVMCASITWESHAAILQRENILLMMQTMVTNIIAIELLLRLGFMAFNKRAFKTFLTEFYLKIYFDENTHEAIHQKIRSHTMPALLYSYSYLLTLLAFFMVPIHGLLNGEHNLPFEMNIPFDYKPWPKYILMLSFCFYLGVLVVSNVISESYLLVTSIVHLNYRLVLLEEDILKLGEDVLRNSNPTTAAKLFRKQLVALLRRNEELHEFAEKLEAQYTRPLFAMMSFSALLLCVLAFNAHEAGLSVENIRYIAWLLAKIAELVVLGYLGSLISTRMECLGTIYYSSNWEKIICKSSNVKCNILTMKLVARAIALNQRPFQLTGMRFFVVTLETTVKILRVAGSYFTFLYSLR